MNDPERKRMETFYDNMTRGTGCAITWGRDRKGRYHGLYAQQCWLAWQEAQRPPAEAEPPTVGVLEVALGIFAVLLFFVGVLFLVHQI